MKVLDSVEVVDRFNQSEGNGVSIEVIILSGGYRPAWPAAGGDHEGRPHIVLRSAPLSLFPMVQYRFSQWPDPLQAGRSERPAIAAASTN
jgi:hypothetical protein